MKDWMTGPLKTMWWHMMLKPRISHGTTDAISFWNGLNKEKTEFDLLVGTAIVSFFELAYLIKIFCTELPAVLCVFKNTIFLARLQPTVFQGPTVWTSVNLETKWNGHISLEHQIKIKFWKLIQELNKIFSCTGRGKWVGYLKIYCKTFILTHKINN